MDERVRSSPTSGFIDQLIKDVGGGALLPNPFGPQGLEPLLSRLTPQDIAGLFSRRAVSLASAAVGNPESPTETGFSGINEPVLAHIKQNELGEKLLEKEQVQAPRAQNFGGFISQMYGDDYNLGRQYGN